MDKIHESPEAELAVLSLLLTDPSLVEVVREQNLPADTFNDRRNQLIYETIMDVEGIADGIVVMDRLKDAGRLEWAGGIDHLTAITESFPDIGALSTHIATLKVKRLARKGVEVATNAINAINFDKNPSKAFADLESELEGLKVSSEQSVRSIIAEQLTVDDKIARGIPVGLPFPWEKIQKVTHGIPYGAVTPLAGRDGKGKSWMGVYFAKYWVLERQIPILYFPTEDTGGRMLKRLACSIGEYDGFSLFNHPTESYLETHKRCMNQIHKLPIYIHDAPCDSDEMDSVIAFHKRKYGINGVVIDGWKDMILKGDNQTAAEGLGMAALVRASKRHKDLAIVPVMHLRDVEDDKWLSKREIRGNKQLTQSARMTMLYQDSGFGGMFGEYGLDTDDGDMVLDVCKCSYGDTIAFPLTKVLEKGRFDEKGKIGSGLYE